jgi:hypothetical protein
LWFLACFIALSGCSEDSRPLTVWESPADETADAGGEARGDVDAGEPADKPDTALADAAAPLLDAALPDAAVDAATDDAATDDASSPTDSGCDGPCDDAATGCPPGFAIGDGGSCVDIDECEGEPSRCGDHGTCNNLEGGFACSCGDGYALLPDGVCADVDECAMSNGGCGLAPCENLPGAHVCGPCPSGFTGANGDCRWESAGLAQLAVEGATFTPAFSRDRTSYVVQLAANLDTASLMATLPPEGVGHATITIDDEIVESGIPSRPRSFASGDQLVTVRVVSDSDVSTTYTLLVRRGWTFGTYFKASNADANDRFGEAIAISADGSTLAVGANRETSSTTGIDGDQQDNSASLAGAVYVFRRAASGWIQEAYLKGSNTEAGDVFGESVSLSADGSTLVVGAPGEDSRGTNVDSPLQQDNSISGAGAAYVFVRNGTQWIQTAYLKASNPAASAIALAGSHSFGHFTAISGDGNEIAVTASGEASGSRGVNGSQAQNFSRYARAGAVYMFRQSASTWTVDGYLKSDDPRSNARFGDAPALSWDGTRLAVGEPSHNIGPGAVHTFIRQASGWMTESRIAASNAEHQDHFGKALALSADGSRLVVGASQEDAGAQGVGGPALEPDNAVQNSGAVYVFAYRHGSWIQDTFIKASNTARSANFGFSVALSMDGRTMAVGAPFEAGTAALGGDQRQSDARTIGAAYLFELRPAGWTQVAYVKSPTAGADQNFGRCVALTAMGASLIVSTENESGGSTGIVPATDGVIDGAVTGLPAKSMSGAVFVYE